MHCLAAVSCGFRRELIRMVELVPVLHSFCTNTREWHGDVWVRGGDEDKKFPVSLSNWHCWNDLFYLLLWADLHRSENHYFLSPSVEAQWDVIIEVVECQSFQSLHKQGVTLILSNVTYVGNYNTYIVGTRGKVEPHLPVLGIWLISMLLNQQKLSNLSNCNDWNSWELINYHVNWWVWSLWLEERLNWTDHNNLISQLRGICSHFLFCSKAIFFVSQLCTELLFSWFLFYIVSAFVLHNFCFFVVNGFM